MADSKHGVMFRVPLLHRYMMMRVLLALLVVTAVQVCATRRRPPFNLNGLVGCGFDPDDSKPSVVPIVPLVPNEPDQFWLPQKIAVLPPRGIVYYKELEDIYMDLYGISINSNLTTVVPPEDRSVPFARTPRRPILVDPNQRERLISDFPIEVTAEEAAQMLATANMLARCDENMMFEWVKLPDYYYPPYALAGRCSDAQRCAIPASAGFRCAPDTQNVQLVDILRWDCCYAMIDKWWMRRCGWRHVQFPTIIHCTCKCTN